jgi:hypothetical protein
MGSGDRGVAVRYRNQGLSASIAGFNGQKVNKIWLVNRQKHLNYPAKDSDT